MRGGRLVVIRLGGERLMGCFVGAFRAGGRRAGARRCGGLGRGRLEGDTDRAGALRLGA